MKMSQVLEVHKHQSPTIPSSNIASAAFSCSPAARKARAAVSSILLLAETSEVIHANLIPSQTENASRCFSVCPVILSRGR